MDIYLLSAVSLRVFAFGAFRKKIRSLAFPASARRPTATIWRGCAVRPFFAIPLHARKDNDEVWSWLCRRLGRMVGPSRS